MCQAKLLFMRKQIDGIEYWRCAINCTVERTSYFPVFYAIFNVCASSEYKWCKLATVINYYCFTFDFISGLIVLALDELVPTLLLMLCCKVLRSRAACLFKKYLHAMRRQRPYMVQKDVSKP